MDLVVVHQANELALQAIKALQDANMQLETKIAELTPKAEMMECLEEKRATITMSEAARRIQNVLGIEIGRNRLYALLRQHGYVLSNRTGNMVSQEAEGKNMTTRTSKVVSSLGTLIDSNTVEVLVPSGLDWLVKIVARWIDVKHAVAEIEDKTHG
jgi:phage antirepressor YoqD-like protein